MLLIIPLSLALSSVGGPDQVLLDRADRTIARASTERRSASRDRLLHRALDLLEPLFEDASRPRVCSRYYDPLNLLRKRYAQIAAITSDGAGRRARVMDGRLVLAFSRNYSKLARPKLPTELAPVWCREQRWLLSILLDEGEANLNAVRESDPESDEWSRSAESALHDLRVLRGTVTSSAC